MKLSSNRELYDYLVALGAELERIGAREAHQTVVAASRTAWTIPATEFLGESRIALREVLKNNLLGSEKQADLRDVLRDLDEALDRR